MKMHSFRSLALGAVLLAVAGVASAGQIDFSSGTAGLNNTNLGSLYTFPGTGLTVQASLEMAPGFFVPSCVAEGSCLYYKYTPGIPSETGLGLTGDPSGANEIYYQNAIGLLVSSGYISGLELGSVQSGESWQVVGCAVDENCTVLAGGIGGGSNDMLTVTGLGNYHSYFVTVPCADNSSTCNPLIFSGTGGTGSTDLSNNILLMSVTTVPEPGTLALLAAGLAALGFAVSRRRKLRTDA